MSRVDLIAGGLFCLVWLGCGALLAAIHLSVDGECRKCDDVLPCHEEGPHDDVALFHGGTLHVCKHCGSVYWVAS